jgi:hypothetical protein
VPVKGDTSSISFLVKLSICWSKKGIDSLPKGFRILCPIE